MGSEEKVVPKEETTMVTEEPVQKAPDNLPEEVASVNDRMTAYKSRVSTVEQPSDKEQTKVNSIDSFKKNYLKKAESPTNASLSPSSNSSITPPGTMSLRDRMKMFENKSNERVVQRETVSQVERAGDIRSKISLWGTTTSHTGYSQKEKIHVGSIDDRRNQYTSLAKI